MEGKEVVSQPERFRSCFIVGGMMMGSSGSGGGFEGAYVERESAGSSGDLTLMA